MCIITGTILGTIGAAIGSAFSAIGSAIGTAATAIGGAIHTALATSVTSIIAGTPVTVAAGATGVGSLTVGGALAGTAAIAGIAGATAIGASMYKNARAVSKYSAQANALKNLNETGQLEVSDTTKTLRENNRIKRTLSSLRVPLGVTPKQNTEDISNNAYGVDTNNVISATQNMMGLNIVPAA